MLSHFQVLKGKHVISFLITASIQTSGAALSISLPVSPPNCPISPFTVVAPPYPNALWPSMAIVPTRALSPMQAASLAAFARQQIISPVAKRWKGMNIYVFSDVKSAQVFKTYQDKRLWRPLQEADYTRLTPIWPKALAIYTYSQGRAKVLYPSKSPKGWWKKH
jgi:hypothetical protein